MFVEMGRRIKQTPEDSTAALEIQQRDVKVVHPTTVPSATVQSLQRYFPSVCCVFIKVHARPFSNGSNALFGSASKPTYF